MEKQLNNFQMKIEALNIINKAFEGKVDKAGEPYIKHLYRVRDNVCKNLLEDDYELECIALLHDLIEDCPEWTIAKLIEHGFSDRVIYGVLAITHLKYLSYEGYLEQIIQNPDAIKVKLADLKDNMDLTRIKSHILPGKVMDRIKKYHNAYLKLSALVG